MNTEIVTWLWSSDEPWTRYRTLVDLLDRPEDDAEVQRARAEMVRHPKVLHLMREASRWGDVAFRRHRDASFPIYALSTLADFGVRWNDPGMPPIVEKVLAHVSPDGAFQTLIFIPKSFGGPGRDTWSWMACDAPTLLYILLAMGLGDDPRVRRAVDHLVRLVQENGWRCTVSPELGRFRGPGRKADPCPIANVYALKALAQLPASLQDVPAVRAGMEMLLSHWQRRREWRPYRFGVGTDFRKIKYPFVWYDILHVTEVLSRFAVARADPRYREMLHVLVEQADAHGRYTARSMYRAWKGWSFADKKHPSPWLTLLVWRIRKRSGELTPRGPVAHAP